ncbi:MAG TPA: hypothetical protein PLZ01_10265 [bacterium]|nr:hypothetical protein [bacterium]
MLPFYNPLAGKRGMGGKNGMTSSAQAPDFFASTIHCTVMNSS